MPTIQLTAAISATSALTAAPSIVNGLQVVQYYNHPSSSATSGTSSACLASNATIGNAVVLCIFVGGNATVASIASPIGTFYYVASTATTPGDTEIWWCPRATGAA